MLMLLCTLAAGFAHGDSIPIEVGKLKLTNVKSLRIQLRGAGISGEATAVLRVTSDGPVRIDLGYRTVSFGKGLHHILIAPHASPE